MGPLAASALLLFAVWDVLLLGRVSSRWMGSEAAIIISFLLATILVARRHLVRSLAGKRPAGEAGVGVIAGWVSYPVWVASISGVGLAIGLSPQATAGSRTMGAASIVATLALAPLFEEILYRERLLLALRDRVGATLAIASTSILFAVPHLEGWSVLGTFLVGLALGLTRLATGSLPLCIGIHAGLNAASVVRSFG